MQGADGFHANNFSSSGRSAAFTRSTTRWTPRCATAAWRRASPSRWATTSGSAAASPSVPASPSVTTSSSARAASSWATSPRTASPSATPRAWRAGCKKQKTASDSPERGIFLPKRGDKKFSVFPKKTCFRHAKQLDGIFRKAYNDEVIGRKGEFPRPLPRFAERPKTVPKQSEGYRNQGVVDA